MNARALISITAVLAVMMGFQNCGGQMNLNEDFSNSPSAEKISLSGRFKVDKFVATSGCPDIDSDEFVCSALYKEDSAVKNQIVEFADDGTIIVEGACNTYYSRYVLDSNGSLGRIEIEELKGTGNVCDGLEAEEEILLVHRLNNSVRIVEEGGRSVMIYTDQSSALKLQKNL